MKKILLLGSTGKMGGAIRRAFDDGYDLIEKSSKDFDAADFRSVSLLVKEIRPDIVINAVAYLGIDPCEKAPYDALQLNTLYPRYLAELANELNFLLIHFSTDAVFSDSSGAYFTESDTPSPLNVYGFTKLGGDLFIQNIAKRYYICRISILFGETEKENQFIEKMLSKVKAGEKVLKVSHDIISSPSYAFDIALEVRNIIEKSMEYGTYHIANQGSASLYDLMTEIAKGLKLDLDILGVSHLEFPALGRKNTCTPISSEKIGALRPWQDAVREYCERKKSVK
ncbi:MAG: NAD(P)-dependent oxidoreductase [Nitrospira sp.]|nr:NAD(P)-dependent oxidoreductase [bacterium]MBL7048022.1 NAD(P)-dependent oxidoreductase [Nitrospira sp.]